VTEVLGTAGGMTLPSGLKASVSSSGLMAVSSREKDHLVGMSYRMKPSTSPTFLWDCSVLLFKDIIIIIYKIILLLKYFTNIKLIN
jgi:hypothetical protein